MCKMFIYWIDKISVFLSYTNVEFEKVYKKLLALETLNNFPADVSK